MSFRYPFEFLDEHCIDNFKRFARFDFNDGGRVIFHDSFHNFMFNNCTYSFIYFDHFRTCENFEDYRFFELPEMELSRVSKQLSLFITILSVYYAGFNANINIFAGSEIVCPENQEDKCPICFDQFESGSRCVFVGCCRRLYHSDCLRAWFGKRRSCPTCRSNTLLLEGVRGE